jgi:hypothetical protein
MSHDPVLPGGIELPPSIRRGGNTNTQYLVGMESIEIPISILSIPNRNPLRFGE